MRLSLIISILLLSVSVFSQGYWIPSIADISTETPRRIGEMYYNELDSSLYISNDKLTWKLVGGNTSITGLVIYPNASSLIGESFNLGDLVLLKNGACYKIESSEPVGYASDNIAVISVVGGYAVLQPKTNLYDITHFGLSVDNTGSENATIIENAFSFIDAYDKGEGVYSSINGTYDVDGIEPSFFVWHQDKMNNANITGGGFQANDYVVLNFDNSKTGLRTTGIFDIQGLALRGQSNVDTLLWVSKNELRVHNSYFYMSNDSDLSNKRMCFYGKDLLYPIITNNVFRGPNAGYSIMCKNETAYYGINVGSIEDNRFFGASTGVAVGSGTFDLHGNTFEGIIKDQDNSVRGQIEVGFDNYSGQIDITDNYFEQNNGSGQLVFQNAILVRGGNPGTLNIENNSAFGPKGPSGTSGTFPTDTMSSFFRATSLVSRLTFNQNSAKRYRYGVITKPVNGSSYSFNHNKWDVDSIQWAIAKDTGTDWSYPNRRSLTNEQYRKPSGANIFLYVNEPELNMFFKSGITHRTEMARIFSTQTNFEFDRYNSVDWDGAAGSTLTHSGSHEKQEVSIYFSKSADLIIGNNWVHDYPSDIPSGTFLEFINVNGVLTEKSTLK